MGINSSYGTYKQRDDRRDMISFYELLVLIGMSSFCNDALYDEEDEIDYVPNISHSSSSDSDPLDS